LLSPKNLLTTGITGDTGGEFVFPRAPRGSIVFPLAYSPFLPPWFKKHSTTRSLRFLGHTGHREKTSILDVLPGQALNRPPAGMMVKISSEFCMVCEFDTTNARREEQRK